MWLRAAFDIAYAIELPIALTPATEVMLTTLPSWLFRRCGIAYFVSIQVPVTLTSNVRVNMSSVNASRL